MRITVLGSGTCAPSLRRSAASLLCESGSVKLLVDIGPGAMRRLLEAGASLFDITHLFLTHFHPDHSGELIPFLFSNRYGGGDAAGRHRRSEPLTIVAGEGIQPFLESLAGAYGQWVHTAVPDLRIVSLSTRWEESYETGGITIRSAPMRHNPESLAYRITTEGGCSMVCSGDTDMTETLVTLSRGTDLLICEAAMPDDQKVAGHLTPALAGEIAHRAGVRKLMLTHFYPECEAADPFRQCRRTFTGPLVLAEDLLQIDIPEP